MSTDLIRLDAAGLGDRIARREVSPVEVVQAYLDRIERLNDTLNAYISVYPERALAAARAAEAEIMAGRYLGPLHGVPLAVKDLFQVAGMQRTCGSVALDEPVATTSAVSVARLEDAGAIILGMLNLHEFAFGPTGINHHYGSARNPWDLTRACGGSSAGSGAAVAGALAVATLGSDTGGSIRIPAALCGVVGLKQTYGLASRTGIFPLSDSFDHGGPLARSVKDAALVLQAIAGADPKDASTAGAEVKDYTQKLGQPLTGMRIGVPRTFFFDDLHPEIAAAVEAAFAVLRDLGAVVEDVDLPLFHESGDAWTSITAVEAYAVHERRLREQGDLLGADVRNRLQIRANVTDDDLAAARATRERVKGEMAAALAQRPILAAPTTMIPAVRLDTATYELDGRVIEGPRVLARLTRPAAFTGQPAISVPCGCTSDGLPVGLQLMAGWFDEPTLLQVAHAYEQATDWHRRVPPHAA